MATAEPSGEGLVAEDPPNDDRLEVSAEDARAAAGEQMAKRYWISLDDALRRLSLQPTIGHLGEELARSADTSTFAGWWLDQENGGTYILAATDSKAIEPIVARARSLGLDPVVRIVQRSLSDLQSAEEAANSGADPDTRGWAKGANIQVQLNMVSVAAEPNEVDARTRELQAKGRDDLLVVPLKSAQAGACNSRFNCGRPLRAGVEIVSAPDAASCTSGFTGRKADGSKWIATAGHCGSIQPSGAAPADQWRNGEQPIAPMRARQLDGYDYAWIRINNTSTQNYWTTSTNPNYNAPGGYMYINSTTPATVESVAQPGFFSFGYWMCHSGKTSGYLCGPSSGTTNTNACSPSYGCHDLVHQIEADFGGGFGDSGGPIFEPYDRIAIGIWTWFYGSGVSGGSLLYDILPLGSISIETL